MLCVSVWSSSLPEHVGHSRHRGSHNTGAQWRGTHERRARRRRLDPVASAAVKGSPAEPSQQPRGSTPPLRPRCASYAISWLSCDQKGKPLDFR